MARDSHGRTASEVGGRVPPQDLEAEKASTAMIGSSPPGDPVAMKNPLEKNRNLRDDLHSCPRFDELDLAQAQLPPRSGRIPSSASNRVAPAGGDFARISGRPTASLRYGRALSTPAMCWTESVPSGSI